MERGSLTDHLQVIQPTDDKPSQDGRKLLFQEEWNRVQAEIEQILVDSDRSQLKAVLDFIQQPYKLSEIRTGVIQGTINAQDHTLFYQQLFSKSKEQIPTCLLDSHMSSPKLVLSAMYEQIMDQKHKIEEDLVEEPLTIQNLTSKHKKVDLQDYDIEKLCQTVSEIVIIVPSFESMDHDTMSTVLSILSGRESLKTTLLLGISSSTDIIHQTLSVSVTSQLSMQKFHLKNAEKTVDHLTKQLLVRPNTYLRMGYHTFADMLESFQIRNLSVQKFIKSYQLACMAHYFRDPLSVLSAKETLSLTDVQPLLNEIRKLPSFKRYVEQMKEDPDLIKNLLTDDTFFSTWSLEQLKRVKGHQTRFGACLEIIVITQQLFPVGSLQLPLRTLYKHSLSGRLGDHDAVKTLLLKLELPAITKHLESCLAIMQDPIYTNHYTEDMTKLQELIKHLTDLVEEYELSDRDQDDTDYIIKTGLKRVRKELEHTRNKSKRADVLHADAVHSSDDDIGEAITRTIQFFSSLFTNCLTSYEMFPLNEIYYFEDRTGFSFAPQPREILHTGLAHPAAYLECKCCKEEISASMEDTMILYRLHLECGRMINMYDLLMAFSTVLEKQDSSKLQVRWLILDWLGTLAERQII
ncbi:origin recognition complex subunit 3 N-terminus-domain-containing protein [Gorgonomyces haynaldii]|nr:origin recognition complex subunit 3 N-terminus-domain-containing protein [Gorgonomyces haynaldii]